MDGKRVKFVLLGIGIALSMGFLVVVGVNRPGNLAYYLTVTEFKDYKQTGKATEGFRVNGKVEEGTIVRRATGQDVSFSMSDGANELTVSYHGIIPDTFVDGADVVVEGKLDNTGTFQAHTLLAKCPSKYESADDPAGDATAYSTDNQQG